MMHGMRPFARLLLVGLVTAAIALAACGGDDDDGNAPDATGSPSPAVSQSPGAATGQDETPPASPDGGESPQANQTPRPTQAAPTPKPPGLDPGVSKIGDGTMTFVLVPSGQFFVDALGLIQPGTETPPCAAFVFSFSWQITDPFPVRDNSVTWRLTRQDATEDVGSGAAGTAAVGCGQLAAVNMGADEVTISLHYFQGAIQG